jgi:alpha-ketoglutarate-dependent taurine dioxygenase
MKKIINFEATNFQRSIEELNKAWSHKENKVFVLKASQTIENVQIFYESIFKFLGTPVPIAEDVNLGSRENQRSGKIWFEVRYDPKHPDAYRHSANAQPLHTDGSYIPDFPSSTLLACEANAGEGGETTFLDSKILLEIMKKEKPNLLDFLLNNKVKHTRSGDTRMDEIIRIEGDDVFINYNYYCVDKNNSRDILEAIEEFQNYLLTSSTIKDATIGVKLAPGDGVFWRDNYCLHGRNSFIANQESERFIWKCAIDIGVFN